VQALLELELFSYRDNWWAQFIAGARLCQIRIKTAGLTGDDHSEFFL